MPITQNDDNGSLFMGPHKLKVGDQIRIAGEGRTRTVTYVMGSDRNSWRACFKGQGAVPTGRVEWEVASAEHPENKSQPESRNQSSDASPLLQDRFIRHEPVKISQPRAVVVGGCDVGVSDNDTSTGFVIIKASENGEIGFCEAPVAYTHREALQRIPGILKKHKADYLVVDSPLLPQIRQAPPEVTAHSCFRPHEDMIRGPRKKALASAGFQDVQLDRFYRILRTIQPQSCWRLNPPGLCPFAQKGQEIRTAVEDELPFISDFSVVQKRGTLEGFPKAFYLPFLRPDPELEKVLLLPRGEKDEYFLRWLFSKNHPERFWTPAGLRVAPGNQNPLHFINAMRDPDIICALSLALNGVLYARGQAAALTSRISDGSFFFGHILMAATKYWQPWMPSLLIDRANVALLNYLNCSIELFDGI